MTQMKDAALSYADREWEVFPLYEIRDGRCSCGYACGSPGKHPRTHNGLEDATLDPHKIEEWWDRWPNANIGIRTGRASGIWVIDVDTKRSVELAPGVMIPEGESSLIELEATYGQIPETLSARTGSGGRHYLFEYPGGDDDGDRAYPNRAGFVPSVDVRGDGGYIVAPPSNHISGKRYEWIDEGDLPSRPPGWLVGYQRREEVSQFDERNVVMEGGRNDYLFRYGSSLLGRGRTHQEVADAIIGANLRLCKPPLAQNEVMLIVEHLMKLPEIQEAEIDLEAFKEQGKKKDDKKKEPDIPEIREGEDLAISLWELLEDPPQPLEAIVAGGILDQADGFILAGQPNLGKSWIAFDLAVAVASGGLFLDKFETKQGPVLIVDEEGSLRSAFNRMKMMIAGRGISYELPIYFAIQKGIRLDTPRGRTIIQRMVERYKPSVIIFDSLVRFHGGDENSSKDMAALFDVAQQIKRAYGSAMCFLHHTRKPSREDLTDPGNLIRGSGDIRGWPDGIMVAMPGSDAEYPGTGMAIHHVKSRNHAKQETFRVGLVIDDTDGVALLRYMGPKFPKRGRDKQIERLRAGFRELTKSGTNPVEIATIARYCDLDDQATLELIATLEEEGLIYSRSVKIKGKYVMTWNLKPHQEELDV